MHVIESFPLDGLVQPVKLVDINTVVRGVTCLSYAFLEDSTKDLAMVHVDTGHSTPKQRIKLGEVTIEGFMAGKGVLTVQDSETHRIRHRLSDKSSIREFSINVGDIMQWRAAANSDLEFYEICKPPYQKGRFENLSQLIV